MIKEDNLAVKRELAKILNILRKTYPHEADTICDLWGEPELNTYIDSLYINTRDDGSKRRGFEFDIIRCIMDISDLHNAMYDFNESSHQIDVYDVKSFNYQTEIM